MRSTKTPSRGTRLLHRRLFLKATALGLSAPLAYQIVRTATAQSEARPKRFLLYYLPHGVPVEHFNPVGEGSNFALDQSGVSVLGPLEPYKRLVNIYQGFKYPPSVCHDALMKFLSGAEVEDTDFTTQRVSIDQFLGNELGSKPLALGAIPHRPVGTERDGMLMWDGGSITPEKNPLRAYDQVFGAGATGANGEANAQLYQSLLTLTESQITSLQTELGSLTRERSKLQVHLESVQGLKTIREVEIPNGCPTAPVLATVDAVRAASEGDSDEWFLRHENFGSILAAQLDIAAASLICNARPLVSVQCMHANSDIDFAFMGSSGGHHLDLSHPQPITADGLADMEARVPYGNAQRWFMEQLTERVVSRLDVPDPVDPSHTVLENTTILIGSEIGDGAQHNSRTQEIVRGPGPGLMSYVPIITLGGGGGALVTGQKLNFHTGGNDGTGDRPVSDVWLTLARAFGSTASTFGGSSTPVAEVLV